MRRTIKFDKNEKNSSFAKEIALNKKKDNQNLADKYQKNNVILNKETYNLIKAQGKIDNEGAKFSHNSFNLKNKRYSNNEDNCLYGSEKESLLESYRFINSRKIKISHHIYFESIYHSDNFYIIKKKAENKKIRKNVENPYLILQNFGEKIEQNLNKFIETIREERKNFIIAQRQENKNFIKELINAQRQENKNFIKELINAQRQENKNFLIAQRQENKNFLIAQRQENKKFIKEFLIAQRQENNRLIIGLAKIMRDKVNMNDFKLEK